MSIRKVVAVLLVVVGGVLVGAFKKHSRKKTVSHIRLHDGSVVKISRSRSLSAKDAREDAALRSAVSQAITAKIMNGRPVAKYDLALKQPYWEYPDGRIKYVK